MKLKHVVLASLLGALSVVIDMLLNILIPIDTVGTAYYAIPIIVIAIFFGIKYSLFIAFIADAITVLTLGIPFFPLFSLASVMWGVIPTILKPETKLWKKILVILITHILVTTINSVAIAVHYTGSFKAMLLELPIRLSLVIPNSIIIALVVEAVIEPIKYRLNLGGSKENQEVK